MAEIDKNGEGKYKTNILGVAKQIFNFYYNFFFPKLALLLVRRSIKTSSPPIFKKKTGITLWPHCVGEGVFKSEVTLTSHFSKIGWILYEKVVGVCEIF